MNVIGLGEAGCKISHYLSKYDDYQTFQIDVENKQYDNFIKIKKLDSHEDYEAKYKPLKINVANGLDTFLILSGAGAISGAVLRILEQLDNNNVKIIYIKPRLSELSSLQKTRHRIVSQVLQEYCRSAKLKEFTIIDNSLIEDLLPEIPLDDYWSPINQLIGDTFHMINFFNKSEPLLKSSNAVPKTAVMSTYSLVDFSNMQEKKLYDLSFPRAKSYYFALGKQFIKDNKDILTQVRQFISLNDSENCDCSYEIHQTDYDQNYVYGYHYASFVQEQDKNLFTS